MSTQHYKQISKLKLENTSLLKELVYWKNLAVSLSLKIVKLDKKRAYWQEKYLKVTEKCNKEGIKPQNKGNIKKEESIKVLNKCNKKYENNTGYVKDLENFYGS